MNVLQCSLCFGLWFGFLQEVGGLAGIVANAKRRGQSVHHTESLSSRLCCWSGGSKTEILRLKSVQKFTENISWLSTSLPSCFGGPKSQRQRSEGVSSEQVNNSELGCHGHSEFTARSGHPFLLEQVARKSDQQFWCESAVDRCGWRVLAFKNVARMKSCPNVGWKTFHPFDLG